MKEIFVGGTILIGLGALIAVIDTRPTIRAALGILLVVGMFLFLSWGIGTLVVGGAR